MKDREESLKQLADALGIDPNGSVEGARVVTGTNEVKTVFEAVDISDKNRVLTRSIQNIGADPVYFNFGNAASAISNHGMLMQGQSVNCSRFGVKVTVFCATAYSVATIYIKS